MASEPSRILVVGGTGRAGAAAVRALLRSGFAVRSLARRPVPPVAGVELTQGDVADCAAVARALEGCSGVHIALSGGPSKASYAAIEVEGTRRIVAAAKRQGVDFLSLTSGASTNEANGWFYATRAKLESERIVTDSGVPHLIVRPTWLMEALPAFVSAGRATIPAKVTQPFRWVSAEDVGDAVASAHRARHAEPAVVYAYGPQSLTMEEAIRRYVAVVEPTARLSPTPLGVLSLVGALGGRPELRDLSRRLRYFARVECEPLGVPTISATTTLERFLENRRDRTQPG